MLSKKTEITLIYVNNKKYWLNLKIYYIISEFMIYAKCEKGQYYYKQKCIECDKSKTLLFFTYWTILDP